MRSIFAIWSDNGRVDYGTPPSRLIDIIRLGIAIAVLAVAAMGIRSVYSEIVANYSSDRRDSAHHDLADTNRDVVDPTAASAIDADHRTARPLAATKPRAHLQTIGLAPIGAPDRSATAEPGPIANFTANPAITPAGRSAQGAQPGDDGIAKLDENKLDENKLDEKLRAAKKQARRASVAHRSAKNDTTYANGADFGFWGNSFNAVPRPGRGRGIHAARPGLFGTPF